MSRSACGTGRRLRRLVTGPVRAWAPSDRRWRACRRNPRLGLQPPGSGSPSLRRGSSPRSQRESVRARSTGVRNGSGLISLRSQINHPVAPGTALRTHPSGEFADASQPPGEDVGDAVRSVQFAPSDGLLEQGIGVVASALGLVQVAARAFQPGSMRTESACSGKAVSRVSAYHSRRVREGDGRARASRPWGQRRLIGRRCTGVVRLVGRLLPAERDRGRSANVTAAMVTRSIVDRSIAVVPPSSPLPRALPAQMTPRAAERMAPLSERSARIWERVAPSKARAASASSSG